MLCSILNIIFCSFYIPRRSAITKLEVDTVQQRQSNAALQHQLDQLRQLVVSNFKVGFKVYFLINSHSCVNLPSGSVSARCW